MAHGERRMKRLAIGALAVAAMLALWAGPTAAPSSKKGFFPGADSFIDDSCGFTLGRASSTAMRLRADKGGEAFYGLDKFWHSDVYTEPGHRGVSFVVRSNEALHRNQGDAGPVGTSMSSCHRGRSGRS